MSVARREFRSGAAALIEAFVRSRSAAGAICDGYVKTLAIFDSHCLADFPGEGGLTQAMVDRWCERRPTESARSCLARCWPVVALVRFARSRGDGDLVVPELPREVRPAFLPHNFTDDELSAFFAECDAWEPGNRLGGASVLRTKRTLPVIFRLLYSSGVRTCEARLLRRANADLAGGVLRIVEGKGRNERLVALHPSMADVMRAYDPLMEDLYPGRTYFFPNGADGFLSGDWLRYHFSRLWGRVSAEHATPYMLRHEYAVRNVDSIASGGDAFGELEYLSKSMGHVSVDVTIDSYYHITPGLAKVLQERCDGTLGDVLPEVVE